jgi:hypothetical protein
MHCAPLDTHTYLRSVRFTDINQKLLVIIDEHFYETTLKEHQLSLHINTYPMIHSASVCLKSYWSQQWVTSQITVVKETHDKIFWRSAIFLFCFVCNSRKMESFLSIFLIQLDLIYYDYKVHKSYTTHLKNFVVINSIRSSWLHYMVTRRLLWIYHR